MTPSFKFLRRVRIHGGECGAVARALRHEAQKDALMSYEQTLVTTEKAILSQAEPGNVSGSTIERKQMSTKTTLKRIALVAVSALGVGLFTAVSPANAAATASFTVDKSSITVITPTSGTGYDSTTANGAIFKIVLRNEGSTKTSQTLVSGETLTASVVGVPTGTASDAKTVADSAGDLTLKAIYPAIDANTDGNPYKTLTRAAFSESSSATWTSADRSWRETNTGDIVNSLYLRVTPTNSGNSGVRSAQKAIDQGEYTIRLRLTASDNSLLVQDTLVKVRFVTSAIGAGLKLTAAASGNFSTSEAALATYDADKYLSATLKDANDGRVVLETSAGTSAAPTLTVDVINKLGSTITSVTSGSTLTAADGGTTADNGVTSESTALAVDNATRNGVYGITTSSTSWLDSATVNSAGGADKLRVRFGDQTATAALTILSAVSSGTASVSVSATGLSVLSTANASTLPLTTTSATVSVSGATAGSDVTFTVTWSGAASGDVTPEGSVATTVVASSSGVATLTLTNSKPIDGASATVAVSGFSTNPTAHVITWRASKAATMSVSLNGAIVALKSSNTFVATVLDHFGAPVSGVVLTPSIGATDSNGSATATYTSVTTDAQGQASYTLKDALAVAAGTDTVTFTHVSSSPITAASSTITYAATAPAPTSLTTFYARTGIAASADSVAEVSTPIPATGIYETPTTATPFQVTIDRDNTRAITRSATGDHLTIRVRALKGAAVVATAPAGAYILNGSNFAVSSRTLYGDTLGDVYFTIGSTKTGANTVTITSGTATASVAFWVATAASKARFVTLTGPATATANGELQNYKVSVTDRYGNPVSGVGLSISATGVAAFGGGATLQTFTTGSTGEFTFTGTSFVSAGGAGSFTASFTGLGTDATSAAGYVASTPVESTLAAGNSSATLAVTFAAGKSAAAEAAEAASDAAAEAIDAANAATDAANLAAEAADAATVAAEEARDAADAATAAVEELATQVATLMAALKAQITTLANTVAKIAKKVRA